MLPITRVEDDGASSPRCCGSTASATLQLNVDPDEVAAFGDAIARCGAAARPAPACGSRHVRRHRDRRVGLVVDSYGLLSIAIDRQSAAEELRPRRRRRGRARAAPDDELTDGHDVHDGRASPSDPARDRHAIAERPPRTILLAALADARSILTPRGACSLACRPLGAAPPAIPVDVGTGNSVRAGIAQCCLVVLH